MRIALVGAMAARRPIRCRSTGRRRCASRSASPPSRCCGSSGSCCLAEVSRGAFLAASGSSSCSIPVWAERVNMTPWHPHHIAERYGLFTIIVLGESVLAATTAFVVSQDGVGALVRASIVVAIVSARAAVRAVVAVLPQPPAPRSWSPPRAGVPVGLRALLRVRVAGGGRCRDRGDRSRRSPTRSPRHGCSSATASPCRSRSSSRRSIRALRADRRQPARPELS